MLKVTWEETALLKHELQKLRQQAVSKEYDLGILSRCNYCLELIDKWILRNDDA